MDFDFFNDWEQAGTVKVGSELIKKVVYLKSFESMSLVDSTFPVGHSDEGAKIERYLLKDSKYPFAKELSNLLSDECHVLISAKSNTDLSATSERKSNPQVLAELLSLILDDKTTHFTLG